MEEYQYPEFQNHDLLHVQENFKNLTIVFVTSGYDAPYIPLEGGIADSLRKLVRQLYIVSPEQNLLWVVQRTKPDLVLVFDGCKSSCYQIEMIRKANIKTAVWMTDDPYFTDKTTRFVPFYDFVFTPEINCVSFYQSLGCKNVHYLPLAADSNVFYPRDVDSKYSTDILFLGFAYENRIQIFDEIAEYLASKKTLISGFGWGKLKSYRLLRRKVYANYWMDSEETACHYNGAKIVINMHRVHDDRTVNKNSKKIPAASINPRTFEISACGAFQLTDIRPELNTFYTIGHDIEAYTTPTNLMEKLEYYLNNEQERKMIAARALSNVQHNHTFSHRVLELLKIVFSKQG